MTSPPQQLSPSDLEHLFSAERLSTYLAHCEGDFAAAVEMYRWNSAITAAFWEPIGHLEVALRNTLDGRLAGRHRRLGRPGSWLDDPAHHQRVWSHAPEERYKDLLALAGYIEPALPGWIVVTSTVPQTLDTRP